MNRTKEEGHMTKRIDGGISRRKLMQAVLLFLPVLSP